MADEEPTPAPVDASTALHLLLRRFLTFVMGYTDTNFFRPAGQRAPAGNAAAPYATIQILDSELLSFNFKRFAFDDPQAAAYTSELEMADLVEIISALETVTVSVQFWKDGAVDGAGRAAWGEKAFDRARRLVKRLELSTSVEQANLYGLGYQSAGKVRNLPAVVDAGLERRSQVDIVFSFGDAEAAAQSMFASVAVGIQIQQPDGHISEVSA